MQANLQHGTLSRRPARPQPPPSRRTSKECAGKHRPYTLVGASLADARDAQTMLPANHSSTPLGTAGFQSANPAGTEACRYFRGLSVLLLSTLISHLSALNPPPSS